MIYIRTRAGVSTRCKIVRRQYVSVSIFYRSQRVEFINVEQRVLSDSFSAISFLPSCTMYRHPQMSRSTIFSSTVFSPFSPILSFFFFSSFFSPPKIPSLPNIFNTFSRYKLRKGLRRCSKASSSNNGIVQKWCSLEITIHGIFFFPSPLPFPLSPPFSESVGRK